MVFIMWFKINAPVTREGKLIQSELFNVEKKENLLASFITNFLKSAL